MATKRPAIHPTANATAATAAAAGYPSYYRCEPQPAAHQAAYSAAAAGHAVVPSAAAAAAVPAPTYVQHYAASSVVLPPPAALLVTPPAPTLQKCLCTMHSLPCTYYMDHNCSAALSMANHIMSTVSLPGEQGT